MKYHWKTLFFIVICLQTVQIQAQNSVVLSQNYHSHRSSLTNSFLKFTSEKNGRVAFLGGSLTYNIGWKDSIINYLTEKFPDTEFDFVSAGIHSNGPVQGAFRFEDDVLINGTVDLLFIESKVSNEPHLSAATNLVRETEGIIRQALISNSTCDIVYLFSGEAEHYEMGETPYEIQVAKTVLDHYTISSINLVKEFDEKILTGALEGVNRDNTTYETNLRDKIYFQSLKTFLADEWNNVAATKKITPKKLPPPIDETSFFKGRQIAPNPRKSIKGWQLLENKNKPLLEGTYPGKIIKFHFKGSAVGIANISSDDAGIIEYSVDNHPWKKQDLFLQKGLPNEVLKYYILESDLKNRKHTLQLRVADEKNPESSGYVCRIRYFFFNGE